MIDQQQHQHTCIPTNHPIPTDPHLHSDGYELLGGTDEETQETGREAEDNSTFNVQRAVEENRKKVGFILLALVILLWAGSSFLLQSLLTAVEYSKALLTTLIQTSLTTLLLIPKIIQRYRNAKRIKTEQRESENATSDSRRGGSSENVILNKHSTEVQQYSEQGVNKVGFKSLVKSLPSTSTPKTTRLTDCSPQTHNDLSTALLDQHHHLNCHCHDYDNNLSSSNSSSTSTISTAILCSWKATLPLGFLWFLGQICFNLSLVFGTVPTCTILSSTSIFFTYALMILACGERFDICNFLAMVLSFVGVGLVTANAPVHTNHSQIRDTPFGYALALISSISYALFVTYLQHCWPSATSTVTESLESEELAIEHLESRPSARPEFNKNIVSFSSLDTRSSEAIHLRETPSFSIGTWDKHSGVQSVGIGTWDKHPGIQSVGMGTWDKHPGSQCSDFGAWDKRQNSKLGRTLGAQPATAAEARSEHPTQTEAQVSIKGKLIPRRLATPQAQSKSNKAPPAIATNWPVIESLSDAPSDGLHVVVPPSASAFSVSTVKQPYISPLYCADMTPDDQNMGINRSMLPAACSGCRRNSREAVRSGRRRNSSIRTVAEEELEMTSLFGSIGLMITVASPLIILFAHFTSLETFQIPPRTAFELMLINGLFGTVLSNYLWGLTVVLLNPIVTTIGTNLQIPLVIIADASIMLDHRFKVSYIIGSIMTVVGVVIVSIRTTRSDNKNGDNDNNRS